MRKRQKNVFEQFLKIYSCGKGDIYSVKIILIQTIIKLCIIIKFAIAILDFSLLLLYCFINFDIVYSSLCSIICISFVHCWSSRKAWLKITALVILFYFFLKKGGKKKRRINSINHDFKSCLSARSTLLWILFWIAPSGVSRFSFIRGICPTSGHASDYSPYIYHSPKYFKYKSDLIWPSMTFQVIFHFTKKILLHIVIVHRKFYQN